MFPDREVYRIVKSSTDRKTYKTYGIGKYVS